MRAFALVTFLLFATPGLAFAQSASPGTAGTVDVRGTGTLNAASTSSVLLIPLNGTGTVGLTFTGLAASGATVSFFESNSTATPASPVASLNAATGVSSTTRTTDGDTRIAVNGHTTLAVQVTTAGTGTVTVAWNVTAAHGIVDVRAPLPPGANIVGKVGFDQTTPGVTNAVGGQGVYLTTPPTLTNGQWYGLQLNASGGLKVDGSAVTQPVSATALPLPSGAATSANQPTTVTAASTTSGQTGTLLYGAVVNGNATYTNGQSQPLQLAPNGGGLKVNTQATYSTTLPAPAAGPTNMQVDQVGNSKTSETGSADPLVGITPVVTQAGTSVVGKTSSGNLYSAYAVNQTTTASYLVCINATAAPAASAAITPVDVAYLSGAVGATAQINYGAGPPNGYSTGITCLQTTSLTTYAAGGNAFIQARVR